MQTDTIIYEESIFAKWLTSILALVTIVFFLMLLYQILAKSTSGQFTYPWFLFLMFLLFLGFTINFRKLVIKMKPDEISVNYGIFKRIIKWENIKKCYVDEDSSLGYGGWGIRIGSGKEGLRLVYNLIGRPRIVLSLKKGKFREFVFSTAHPQKVIEIVSTRSPMKKSHH